MSTKQFQRIQGRHIFLRELNCETREMKVDGRDVASDISSALMARHGDRRNALSSAKKGYFDEKQFRARVDAEAVSRHRIVALDGEIEDLRQALAKDRPEQTPTCFSDCRFCV